MGIYAPAPQKICLLLLLLTSLGCTPAGDFVRLRFVIQGPEATNPAQLLPEFSRLPQDWLEAALAPPTTASGFNCLGVNVVGPGIFPPAGHHLPQGKTLDDVLQSMMNGETCTYPGITTLPISLSATTTVDLQVPAGSNRIIQVGGIVDSTSGYCNRTVPLGEVDGEMDVYELGRARIDLFSEQTVNITNTYNALSAAQQAEREMACDDSGSFSPASLSGLSAWFNGEQYASQTDGTDITTPWQSLGGLSINLTPINPPKLYHTAPNGHATIRFDGVNDEFHTSTTYMPASMSGFTVYLVAKQISGAGTFMGISNSSTYTGSPDRSMFIGDFSGHRLHAQNGLSGMYPVGGTPSANYDIHFAMWDPSDSTMALKYQIGAQTMGYIAAVGLETGYTFSGGYMHVGTRGSGTWLNGEIAEIIVYTRALSSSEQASVRGYLTGKYGLP
ncbi:MAG: hypothetical protein AB7P04_06355 [Bacteriovoracia bacterium]